MLKFFRRIRRKLIDDGNLKKYLIYAIGEILLVMIGILLALQVNNWNIDKNNKQTLLKSYKQLSQSLENDLSDLDRVVNGHIKGWNAIEPLLNQLLNRDSFDNEILYNIRLVSTIGNYKPRLSSFEAIKLNGIELIENEVIANQLFLVYEEITSEYKSHEDEIIHIQRTFFEPYFAKYTKVKGGSFNKFEFRDFNKFATDSGFLGNIRKLHINHYLVFSSAMRLQTQIKLLIALIKAEVNQIKKGKKIKIKPKKTIFKLPNYEDAKNVSLVGNFEGNESLELKMILKDSIWQLGVNLMPLQIHYYRFNVDGKWVHDINNPNKNMIDGNGNLISYKIPQIE